MLDFFLHKTDLKLSMLFIAIALVGIMAAAFTPNFQARRMRSRTRVTYRIGNRSCSYRNYQKSGS